MYEDKLFKLGSPAFYTISMNTSQLADLYLGLVLNHKEYIIRIIRGKKSRNINEFFNEVGAALQFPYYFGENWPAFDECITDLDWIPGHAYLLIVNDANLLFCNEGNADFRVLIKVLTNANKEWLNPNQYFPRDLPATPFHVLFQDTESNLVAFLQRLTEAGATAERL